MKYAIVESGGKQYKAVEGDTIEVDRLPISVGTVFKLKQVLLLVDGKSITVGTPTIKGTDVITKVIDHSKGPKLVVFKYRPKKRIRVKTGHRQNYTRLLIEQIGEKAEPKAQPAVEKETKPAKKATAKAKKTAPPKVAPKKVTPVASKKTTSKPSASKTTKAASTKTTKKPASKSGKTTSK